MDLLKAQVDEATVGVDRLSARVKILEDLVNIRRQTEAETARTHAVASRREAEGKHPLVLRLVEQNVDQ